MVKLIDIEFSYPGSDFQLQVPRFEIKQGESLAIVGASGSGKTSLLNLIAGILVPNKGDVLVADALVSAKNKAQRRAFRLKKVGLVFQEFELLDYLSNRENILLPFRLSSKIKVDQKVQQRLDDLAASSGLKHLLDKYPGQLSQGEKQRVAVCRALIGRPEMVLADEPTGNLDPKTKNQIMDLLLRSVKEISATLVMVTHDHALLDRFDRWVDFSKLTSQKSI